jgi:hypothetical protein
MASGNITMSLGMSRPVPLVVTMCPATSLIVSKLLRILMPKPKKLPPAQKIGERRRVTVGHLCIALDLLVGIEPGAVGAEVLPRSKTRRVELIWPKIAYALERGYRPKEIWEPLAASGIGISADDFRRYVSRIREKKSRLRREEARTETGPFLGYGERQEDLGVGAAVSAIESKPDLQMSERPVDGTSEPGAASRRPSIDDMAARALRDLRRKGPEWPSTPLSVKDVFG